MNRFINVSKLGGRSLSVLVLCAIASAPSWATDQHMMAPRVPMDQIEEARVLTSPLPESTGIIEKEKHSMKARGSVSPAMEQPAVEMGPARPASILPRATFSITGSGAIGPRAKFFG